MAAPHTEALSASAEHAQRTALSASVVNPASVGITEEFRELMPPAVERRGGKVVKLSQDRLLASFSSADAAAWCALEVQFGFHLRNATAAQPLDVKVGISTGPSDSDEPPVRALQVAGLLESSGIAGDILISPSSFAELYATEDFAVLPRSAPLVLPHEPQAMDVYEIVWRSGDPHGTRPPMPDEAQILLASGSPTGGLLKRLLKWGK